MREEQWPGQQKRYLPPQVNGEIVSPNIILLRHIRDELHEIRVTLKEQQRPKRSLRDYTDFLQTVLYIMLLLGSVLTWVRDPGLFGKIALALALK